MITLCPSFTGLRASFLKIYQNSLTLTKLTKLQRSIRTMSKTLTSQLQAKQSHQAKGKKANESAAPNKFLSSFEKKANTQEATGPKINDTLASHVTSIMRQKPERVRKIYFRKFSDLRTVLACQK